MYHWYFLHNLWYYPPSDSCSNSLFQLCTKVITLTCRVSYSGCCSATGMRHIWFERHNFVPKIMVIFKGVFYVFFWIIIKMLSKDFIFYVSFFNESIARHAYFWINLTHLTYYVPLQALWLCRSFYLPKI